MENSCKAAASGDSRRGFIKQAAKKAAWAAPTMTLLVAASAQSARAQHGYGGADEAQYGELRGLRRRVCAEKE
jgi:hypothetical protein